MIDYLPGAHASELDSILITSTGIHRDELHPDQRKIRCCNVYGDKPLQLALGVKLSVFFIVLFVLTVPVNPVDTLGLGVAKFIPNRQTAAPSSLSISTSTSSSTSLLSPPQKAGGATGEEGAHHATGDSENPLLEHAIGQSSSSLLMKACALCDKEKIYRPTYIMRSFKP